MLFDLGRWLALSVISEEGVSDPRKAGLETVYPPGARPAQAFFAFRVGPEPSRQNLCPTQKSLWQIAALPSRPHPLRDPTIVALGCGTTAVTQGEATGVVTGVVAQLERGHPFLRAAVPGTTRFPQRG